MGASTKTWIIVILLIILILIFLGSLAYQCGFGSGSGIFGSFYTIFNSAYIIILVELALIFLSATIAILIYERNHDKATEKLEKYGIMVNGNNPTAVLDSIQGSYNPSASAGISDSINNVSDTINNASQALTNTTNSINQAAQTAQGLKQAGSSLYNLYKGGSTVAKTAETYAPEAEEALEGLALL